MAVKKNIEVIDTLQSVELGEGVEIMLRIAGPFPRALALLLDMLIIGGVMLIFTIIMAILEITSGNPYVAEGIRLIVAFFVSWGYFVYFECGRRGATVGKRALGLRVVDRSGNNASRGQIFVRNILRLVDMMPGIPGMAAGVFIGSFGLGFMCCILTKKFQRIGDLVANTVVVYTHPDYVVTGQQPNVEHPVAPTAALAREEQVAIADFYNRAGLWSEARRIELADHASELTREKGMRGMVKLLGMAKWIKERGK